MIEKCDSVYWADVRGSMPDLVQAVGRALRMQPGEGRVASLVVPVLLGPGETADNMLTSQAFGGLAMLLAALRAHDSRIVESLAEQQAASRYKPVRRDDGGKSTGGGEGSEGISAPAKALLKFSTPRGTAALAAFINLRVRNPEHEHWRHGVEAAVIYAREHGDLRVPFTFRVPAAVDGQDAEGKGWPAPRRNGRGARADGGDRRVLVPELAGHVAAVLPPVPEPSSPAAVVGPSAPTAGPNVERLAPILVAVALFGPGSHRAGQLLHRQLHSPAFGDPVLHRQFVRPLVGLRADSPLAVGDHCDVAHGPRPSGGADLAFQSGAVPVSARLGHRCPPSLACGPSPQPM